MANKKVALVWYGKSPAGWRRIPAVIGKNGRVKPVKDEVGHFELRFYVGRRLKYENVGTDAADALTACDRKTKLLAVKDSARAVGVKVIEEKGRVRLTEALDRFVGAAQARGSNEAAEVYRTASEEFLGVVKRVFADEVRIEDFTKYHIALRKRGLADRTVSNRHKLTVAFLKFASVPADAIPKASPKFGSTVPEVYTPKELKTFFKSLETEYHRVVFNLALQCGLREQELMHVYWADIDFVHKTLLVRSKPEWNFKIKDQEERSIPLADDFLKLLKSYRTANPGRQLVTGTSGDKPSTKLLRTLKRLVHHAELNCTVCKGCVARNECEEWFLHKFRASFITTLLRSGMDLRTVMQLSGHSDLKSVMRYLRPAEGSELRTRMNQVAWGV